MDATALKALQAPLKDKYRRRLRRQSITLKAEGRLGEGVTCSVKPARRWSRPGCTRQPAARECSLLRRHAAGGARRLRRRHAQRGRDSAALKVREPASGPKAISISAARWASPRRRRWASANPPNFEIDGDLERGAESHADEADRALLRRLSDLRQPPPVAVNSIMAT